jgi:hypothetical protein
MFRPQEVVKKQQQYQTGSSNGSLNHFSNSAFLSLVVNVASKGG